MEVYLDNSATTKAYESVGDVVRQVMCGDYGNPSSMHKKGMDAEAYINTKSEKEFATEFESRIAELYKEYITDKKCTVLIIKLLA